MSGEKDLAALLRSLRPVLQPGEYVFCTRPHASPVPPDVQPVGTFSEAEGLTVIVPRAVADAHAWPYSFVAAWLTLTVYSALDAVGLTAAVTRALTQANISCNVVAAFYHDHLFVPAPEAERALRALQALSENGAAA
ncbi:MAG: ACT domain-containing protein [Anaerolineales bacterium]|nr:ACT domain-containing protein [Anaerolineales bacterium]